METTSRPLTGLDRDRAMLRAAALRIIRTIEDMPRIKIGADVRRGLLAPPSLSVFRSLEPIGFGLVDEAAWWTFHPRDCTPDLVWPLDVGMVTDPKLRDDAGITLRYARTISPKEVRGSVTRFGPFMVRIDNAQMLEGRLATTAGIYVWLGGQWNDANGHGRWSGDIRDHHEGMTENDRLGPSMATSIALRQRYEWAVSLGLEHSPSIRFATDPTGMKDIFRIRDLPEGRDRRAALMTWVSDHWRQDRHDPDVEIYVRKHLRGSVQFTWQGMNAEISPSKFDVEQRDRFIAEREAKAVAGDARRQKASG